jgi:hypothetical protein
MQRQGDGQVKHEQLRNHVEEKKDELLNDMNSVLESHGIQGHIRGVTFAATGSGDCPPGKVPVVVIKVDPNTGATIRTIECR